MRRVLNGVTVRVCVDLSAVLIHGTPVTVVVPAAGEGADLEVDIADADKLGAEWLGVR